MNQDNIEPGRHYWILINNMKTIGLAAPDGGFYLAGPWESLITSRSVNIEIIEEVSIPYTIAANLNYY